MRKKIVSIITGWGDTLGTGHIQRMALLASFLNKYKGITTQLVCDYPSKLLPLTLREFFSLELLRESAFIIRDKRDSSVEEMLKLQKMHTVVTIDDCGPGRSIAEASIDLLPNLIYPTYRNELFLYGYNFHSSIEDLQNRTIDKTIDVAVYTGYGASPDYIKKLVSLIPYHCTAAFLCGENSFMIKNGASLPLNSSFAEMVLCSKVLITHFGIALFEGYLSECRLATINPTEYHSLLADKAAPQLNITNLGVNGTLDDLYVKTIIADLINNPISENIQPHVIIDKIHSCLNNFYSETRQYI